MVRQASDTAVNASISTPVWPVTRTVARTTKPVLSGAMSTATCVMGRGWQSGINSCVFFAAMMPAIRAAPSTSPFLALPASTRSSVGGAMTTRPSAIATRPVAALAETSTMRASPPLARWVRVFDFAIRSLGGAGAPHSVRQQRARGRCHIGLSHQTFADQEGRDAGRGEARQIRWRGNATFADQDAIARNQGCQSLACFQRRLKCFQVAVVDADQRRAQFERARELGFVVP